MCMLYGLIEPAQPLNMVACLMMQQVQLGSKWLAFKSWLEQTCCWLAGGERKQYTAKNGLYITLLFSCMHVVFYDIMDDAIIVYSQYVVIVSAG